MFDLPDRPGGRPPGDYLRDAADVLEDRSEYIVAAYERRLLDEGSPLVVGGAVRRQIREQARAVLTSAAGSLRGEGGAHRPGSPVDPLSETIGTLRAREGVHASESFRAVAALSGAALSTVIESLPPSPSSANEVAEVAGAIQESVAERVANASVAYGDYLLARLHESHIDERRRIGREVHDRVAHAILVVFRNLELFEMYEARDPEKAREKLRLAKSTAQEALGWTRELSSGLRNSSAEEGLEVALSDYLRLVSPPGIDARVSFGGDEALLTPEVRDELFLIVREAVSNALRHSGARRVRVRVRIGRDKLRGSVLDDGWGFDPDAAGDAGGTGLASMAERAALMGGALTATSVPGKGTRVQVVVPLPRDRS